MSEFAVTVKTGKDEAKHYTKDTLTDGAKLTVENDSFQLTFDKLPKDTEVTVTYSVRIDRDTYLAAGGEEGKVLTLKNAFHVASADGAVDSDSKSGTIEVDKPLTKSGKVITKKAENGNPIVTWDFDVNLYSLYTEKELQELQDVTVSDVLSPVLIADLSSIKLTDSAGKAIPADAYKVSQKRSVLAIQILDPDKYPIFHLQFETECGASVDGLVNSADLRIDGNKVTSTKTDDIGEINAVTQHGHIKSMKVPEYTLVAWKYLDNELCTKAGLFEFSIRQVYLLKNGERYENMSVTLNEENNWTYTWKNLPIAGGEYSVEEVPVLGYEADVKDGDWHSTLTNTVQTGDLLIAKQVKGSNDPKKKYHFTLTLLKDGNADAGTVALNGTFGDVTFQDGVAEFDVKAGSYIRVKGLPAGVYYTIQEDDYTKAGFNSPEYINQSGVVQKGDSTMVTVTNTKVGVVRTGDDSNMQMWAILALLALMGCVAPVMDLRRRHRA